MYSAYYYYISYMDREDAREGKKFSLASSHATVLEIVSNHVRL